MSRKQKIIVSITGIVLVSLILIGLTYAYFLTQITGNTNAKSISVTTANLVLEYGENTNVIQGIENAEPGYSVEKIFTATNKGNSTVTYGAALESIVNELSRQEDLVYTLTCTSYLKEGFSLASDGTITGTVDGTCSGSDEKQFPSTSTMSIMTTNTIDVLHTHVYKLTVTYKEMGVDQSEDMNKSFSVKVNIVDLRANADKINPYSTNKKALNYQIINNALEGGTNKSEYSPIPKTKVAKEITSVNDSGKYELQKISSAFMPYGFAPWLYSDTEEGAQQGSEASGKKCEDLLGKYIYDQSRTINEVFKVDSCEDNVPIAYLKVFDYEKTLSTEKDDYGTSYYYRGNVLDNYVNFAGMCWRIVRISGDGSVKLILEDQDETCSETMDGNWDIPTTTGGSLKKGNFGYTEYAIGSLTASDGTTNSKKVRLMNYLDAGTNKEKSMATAFENFQTGPLADYLDKLKVGDWCLNDKAYTSSNSPALTGQEILDNKIKNIQLYYDSNIRLCSGSKPTLKCGGTNMSKFKNNTDMYVGTLTADEAVYAGGKCCASNKFSYLINEYQRSNGLYFGTLSLFAFFGYRDYQFNVNTSGDIYVVYEENISFRPAIQLKSNIQITGGDGTKENPYEIAS